MMSRPESLVVDGQHGNEFFPIADHSLQNRGALTIARPDRLQN
jgi:hypothetical protein